MSEAASILVVDDTTTNLDLLETILKMAKYKVQLASKGTVALNLAAQTPPDLILLDISMPDMDGYEVCTKLKANALTAEIPVIFISALDQAQDKVQAFEVGGVDYIPKPFQIEEVLARVNTHLKLQELQNNLLQANNQLRILLDEQVKGRQQLEEAAAVFHVSNDGIILTDSKGIIKRINPAFTKITGYSAKDVIGQTPRILQSGHHSKNFYVTIWETIRDTGFWAGEIWNRRKDGSVYLEWETITAIKDSQNNTLGYVSQFSDIGHHKSTDKNIENYGNYDTLTSLANRTLLLERLTFVINEHRRNSQKLALICIDLDAFKQINDTLGYIAGDLLLQQVAKRISNDLRDIDTAARIVSDEFAVMLTNINQDKYIERKATRLLEILSQPYDLQNQAIKISASIGIAIFPHDGDNPNILLRNANLSVQRAKKRGRKQIQFFTEEMERKFLECSELNTDLNMALQRQELQVHYQPIVFIHNKQLAGFEALLRWQRPNRQMVPPDRFITIAEENGLIEPIGKWTVATVCQQIAIWQSQGRSLYTSVNVSTRQIPKGLPPSYLKSLLAKFQIPPERLILEITESAFVKNIKVVVDWLQEIRNLGIRIYLDDFGTGWASLSYLKHLPVDTLKIDKAFIKEIISHKDQALVRAILALADGLELSVVAEGIETQEQLNILNMLNCKYGQGYLFSRPLFGLDLEDFLAKY